MVKIDTPQEWLDKQYAKYQEYVNEEIKKASQPKFNLNEFKKYIKIKIQESRGHWEEQDDGRQYIKKDGSKGVFVRYKDDNDKGTLIASNPLVRRANKQWDRDNREIQRKARIDSIKTADNDKYIDKQKGKHFNLKFSSFKLNYNNLSDESKNIIKIYKIEDRIKNFDFDKIKDKNGNVIKFNDDNEVINIKKISGLKDGYDGKIYRGGIDIDNKLIRVVFDDKQNILDVFIENHKSDYDKKKQNWIEKYKRLNENRNFKNFYFLPNLPNR